MGCNDKVEFAYQMGKYTTLPIGQVKRLMRLAATHDRLEVELSNGYKKPSGSWDEQETVKAQAKVRRIGRQLEKIAESTGATIDYGALTVRIVASGRDIYIPGGER